MPGEPQVHAVPAGRQRAQQPLHAVQLRPARLQPHSEPPLLLLPLLPLLLLRPKGGGPHRRRRQLWRQAQQGVGGQPVEHCCHEAAECRPIAALGQRQPYSTAQQSTASLRPKAAAHRLRCRCRYQTPLTSWHAVASSLVGSHLQPPSRGPAAAGRRPWVLAPAPELGLLPPPHSGPPQLARSPASAAAGRAVRWGRCLARPGLSCPRPALLSGAAGPGAGCLGAQASQPAALPPCAPQHPLHAGPLPPHWLHHFPGPPPCPALQPPLAHPPAPPRAAPAAPHSGAPSGQRL